ncbi:MAG: twin-arginine translocase TatA/TatE family subunit [Candidatus Sulfotelmatobacter sp.]
MSLSEMFFLGLLGLVIFGPKKLAEFGQQAGKIPARLKKASSEFQSQPATEISATASDLPMQPAPVESSLVETGPAHTGLVLTNADE